MVPYIYLAASALAIPLPFGYISNIQAFVALALVASALEIPLPFDDILNIQAFVALASASASAYGDTSDTQAFVASALALA